MKAGAAGGIEAVVKVINAHIYNASICEQGCRALANMIINGKNTDNTSQNSNKSKLKAEHQAKAVTVGGIEIFEKVKMIHKDDSLVFLLANLLHQLISQNMDNWVF